ncbi:MAG: PEP-CTERM sorting domain-containing protein, partial [Wenzhouxiangella sp.]|nr:PEP-CTERM sorting domain-containing protein [Wenzhouxiangella sp.]
AASLAIALPSQAAIIFDAQFVETAFGFGDGRREDARLDQFIFSLTQDGPGTFDVTIDALFLTFGPSARPGEPIVVDLDDPNIPDPTPNGIPVGVDDYFELVADGAGGFALGFIGFGIGDGFAYNIDIDDEDARVNGDNATARRSAFSGSTIEIVYTDNGVPNTEPLIFEFGRCETGSRNDCSAASGFVPATNLATVPAPMSVALMGLGLLGLASARRRRK